MLNFCFLLIVVYLKVKVSQIGLLGQKIIGFVTLITTLPVMPIGVYNEIVHSTSIAIEHLLHYMLILPNLLSFSSVLWETVSQIFKISISITSEVDQPFIYESHIFCTFSVIFKIIYFLYSENKSFHMYVFIHVNIYIIYQYIYTKQIAFSTLWLVCWVTE